MSMIGNPAGAAVSTQQLLTMFSNISQDSLEGAAPPSEAFITWLHGQASTTKPQDMHHMLGFQESNAAYGNHRHNGKDSLKIIPDGEFQLTDLSGTPATSDIVNAINRLNSMARTYLGAT